MNPNIIKSLAIGSLCLWVILFTIDSIFGINWPSHSIQRAFIWFPTVIIGLYWLIYGGMRKKEKQD
ncbi:MAG: hypothetical protein JKY87_04955 [Mariprofundus sp.]|nr:hypothetical protein [Mariprofundus sp.]